MRWPWRWLVWLLLLRGDGGTEYTLLFQSAGQLVKDDDVQVGGRRVGSVADDRAHRRQPGRDQGRGRGAVRAAARGHDGRHPLTSLSGIANRYVALTPGAGRRQGAAGRRHAARPDSTTDVVDLDQIFNTLDERTRGDLAGRHQGLRRPVRGQGRRGRPVGEVLQPAAVDLAPARAGGRPRTRARSRASSSTPRGPSPRSPSAATTCRPRRQRERDRGGDRAGERRAGAGARPAADHAAARQHDVREPARHARRPRRARRRVQARDQGPRAVPARAAPARRAPRGRRSATCALLVRPRRRRQRPGRGHAASCPRLQHVATPGLPQRPRGARAARSRCSSSRAPTRPTSSAGSATSARAPRTTTPTATSRASSRSSTPSSSPTTRPAACSRRSRRPARLDGLQTGADPPLPGRRHAAAAGRLGAVHATAAASTATRRLVAPRPMRRVARHRPADRGRRRVRGRRAGRGRRRRRRLQGPRDLRQRRLRHPGRGRQGRGRQGRRDRLDRRHATTTRPPSCSTSPSPGYQDFRQDAECIVRPQSLIGERFVECTPTQPRSPGDEPPPALRQDRGRADGEGQYLLPVERTGKPVDLDLINNIMRQPEPPAPVDHPHRPRASASPAAARTSTRSSAAPTRR